MDRHLNKNGLTRKQWLQEVDKMRSFAKERRALFTKHISSQFSLEGTYELELNVEPNEAGRFVVNGNWVEAGHRGVYFSNIPLEVKAVANPQYVFDRWKETGGGDVLFLKGDKPQYTAVFKKRERSDRSDVIKISEANIHGTLRQGRDWLEITNYEEDESFDISGWKFTSRLDTYVFPKNSVMKPGESVILSYDTLSFAKKNKVPDTLAIFGPLAHGFGNECDEFALLDQEGKLVDHIVYDTRTYKGKWPERFTLVRDFESENLPGKFSVADGKGTPGDGFGQEGLIMEAQTDLSFWKLLWVLLLLIWA
jgi:hypothetical protein